MYLWISVAHPTVSIAIRWHAVLLGPEGPVAACGLTARVPFTHRHEASALVQRTKFACNHDNNKFACSHSNKFACNHDNKFA